MRILIGGFVALHGMVHLWYVVLSLEMVTFKSEMGWEGKSWILSSFFGDILVRNLAVIMYSIATLIFVIAGFGFIFRTEWIQPLLIGGAVFSSVIILLYWDGSVRYLVEQGMIGLLINVGILVIPFFMRD